MKSHAISQTLKGSKNNTKNNNIYIKHVTNEYSHIHKDVVLFHFLPSSQTITMTKSSDSKYHFLSDWFFDQFI
ncbi:unnamed protein product [Rotaria sordida]|uniref:Uncharacterized protein n=1 Tax=Rotaria sordida TaxID=392033 RepID=A0A815N6G0_9BILA|nr:unnamed protein product [Rotaria sordida]